MAPAPAQRTCHIGLDRDQGRQRSTLVYKLLQSEENAMTQSVVILQGHPDARERHLCHLLADRYREAAIAAGHEVTLIDVGALDFPMLSSPREWQQTPAPDSLLEAQAAIVKATHMVVIYPLWLGTMPARFKGFLEQVLRPALFPEGTNLMAWRKLKKGCSVRVLVTMGMPAMAYRLYFRAHSLKSLERNILAFIGLGPIRSNLFGMVDKAGPGKIYRWLRKVEDLGKRAR
jgi:putative NADPH-quinone reductase